MKMESYVDPKAPVTVLNTAPDGSQKMSDGTVRIPAEPKVVVGDPNVADSKAVAVPQRDGGLVDDQDKAVEEAKKRDGVVAVDDLSKDATVAGVAPKAADKK